MLPIGDDNSDRTITPLINYLLIAANIVVFVFFQGLGTNEKFTYAFSTIPKEILTGQDIERPVVIANPVTGDKEGTIALERTPVSVYLTLITSMFMHGGFAHIFGNMLYLWIFGDNLENLMGHRKYLIFYLLCGLAAGLAHVFSTAIFGGNPLIPCLGASGAISGVLGGYLILFPHRRVTVLFMRQIMQVPAVVTLGIWIVFQLVNSMGVLGGDSQAGGVAYAAHVGGFVAGILLVKLFVSKDKRNYPAYY